jgi:hypothetical protein
MDFKSASRPRKIIKRSFVFFQIYISSIKHKNVKEKLFHVYKLYGNIYLLLFRISRSMSAIVDRIDNGDNYNEDDARRYFNELIDIVYIPPPKIP